MFNNTHWAESMVRDLSEYFEPDASGKPASPKVRLNRYPTELVEKILANETSHNLLEMAHIDAHGYPFISVMGFALIDGKIHLSARRDAIKLKRLRENPRCSVNYHNKRGKHELACLTLVGRATLSEDPEKIRLFNELLSCKCFPDDSSDMAQRAKMMSEMNGTDRVLIVLDRVDAVYIQAKPAHSHRSGTPIRVATWRADWADN